jgi:hypothetical protein
MTNSDTDTGDVNSAIFEDGQGVVVNLEGIAEAKFENIPKGVYEFECDTCECKTSSKGSLMLETWWRVTGPEGHDSVGRKLPYYLVFSPKALPFTKAAINRIEDGPSIFAGAFRPQDIADSGQLLGKRMRGRVGLKEYEGEDRSNITQVLPLQQGSSGGGQASGAFA